MTATLIDCVTVPVEPVATTETVPVTGCDDCPPPLLPPPPQAVKAAAPTNRIMSSIMLRPFARLLPMPARSRAPKGRNIPETSNPELRVGTLALRT